MRKFLSVSVAAVTAVSAVAFSTSAAAYDYNDYYGRRGNDNASAAIVAGVIGLAVGAAIASSNKNRYGSYGGSYGYGSTPYGYGSSPYGNSGSYGSPYGYGGSYGGTPYGYGSGSYGGTPYGYGGGYGGSYGGNPYGYNGSYGGYGQRCSTQRVWDSYSRRYTTRQICY